MSMQDGEPRATHALTTDRPADATIVALYEDVGWTAYTREPERLLAAIDGSGWVRYAISSEGDLVGLCRAIGDGHTVCHLQDVLVHPDHQRRGIGRRLVQACLDDHAHVRQLLLLTDGDEAQRALYRSVGMVPVAELGLESWMRTS